MNYHAKTNYHSAQNTLLNPKASFVSIESSKNFDVIFLILLYLVNYLS